MGTIVGTNGVFCYRPGPLRMMVVAATLFGFVVSATTAAPVVRQDDGRSRPLPDRMRSPGPDGMRGPGDRPQQMERRRRGSPPPLWKRFSADERAAVARFIEEHFPRMYLELERLRKNNPDRFAQRMKRIAPEVRRMMEMMEVNPERGALMIQERQLDIEIRHLAGRYRSMDEGPARSKLYNRIQKACGKAFDCRHERRALEIRGLEARIAELEQRHQHTAQMRDELINQELRERLGKLPPPKPKKETKTKARPKSKKQPKPD